MSIKYHDIDIAGTPEVDIAPTAGSTNAVSSGGVKTAIDNVVAGQLLKINAGTVSALPLTIANAAITVDHVLLSAELTTPSAQRSAWNWTTSAGQIQITGSITGSTALILYLGKTGTSI